MVGTCQHPYSATTSTCWEPGQRGEREGQGEVCRFTTHATQSSHSRLHHKLVPPQTGAGDKAVYEEGGGQVMQHYPPPPPPLQANFQSYDPLHTLCMLNPLSSPNYKLPHTPNYVRMGVIGELCIVQT